MDQNMLYLEVKLARGLSIPEKEMNIDICVTLDFLQRFASADRSYEVFPAHSHTYILKSEWRKKQNIVWFEKFKKKLFHTAQMRGEKYTVFLFQYFHLVTGCPSSAFPSIYHFHCGHWW